MTFLAPNPVVLALGAHVDDVELGCGGTLLRMITEQRAVVHLVVLTPGHRLEAAARRAEAEEARSLMGAASVTVLDFDDTRLPIEWWDVQQTVEELIALHRPDVILLPRASERHQDHRVIADVVDQMTATVPTVLRYEVLRDRRRAVEDALYVDVGLPVPAGSALEGRLGALGLSYADAKLEVIARTMRSQRGRPYLEPDVIAARMVTAAYESRTRGLRHAEAFDLRLVWGTAVPARAALGDAATRARLSA